MKKDKNRIYGRLIKRSVSLMLCAGMLLNSGGDIGIRGACKLFNHIAAYASSLDQITNGEEPATLTINDASNNITSLTITKSSELLWLANQPASRYSSAVITITAGNGSPFSNEIVDFPGLGSETAPFGGTLQTSAGSTLYLFSDHALFNYILDTAKIHQQDDESLPAVVVINRVGDSDTALLAENVVHDTFATENDVLFDKLNMRIQLEENMNDVELKPFSGIIGTVGSGCRVKLNTFLQNNQIPEITSSGNVGLACCELGGNSKLTFHYENGSNVNDYSVNSTDECAGGLVGIMRQGSELIVENDFSYKGNVSAGKSAGGLAGIMEGGATVTISNGGTTVYSGKITAGTNAGGLVGEMGSGATLSLTGNYTLASNAVIEGGSNAGGLVGLTEDEELNITGKTVISGTLKAVNAGGLAGYAKYSGNRTISAAHTATSGIDINGVTVSGTRCGGIFGCLENTGTTGKITISGGSLSSKAGENSTNYGGLAGSYKAAVLEQELDINGITVTANRDGNTITSFGGLIGILDGGTNGAYVQIHGITTANTNDVSSDITNYGGIVGNGGDNGNFVDITGGTVTVATDSNITDNNGYNGSAAGGLVGSMTSGVLRLNGTVNLSAAKPADNCKGTGRGLVLGYRRNTLVYAESGFTMTRYGTLENRDDIGQWGDIVRYSAVGGNATIEYNSTDHTVKIKKHETLTNVGSNQDLARLALYIQLNTAGNKGALRFEDPAFLSSTLLTSDININADVSFAETGINSLTRDDGSNGAFTAMLDGKNHKVTLAVGDSSTGFRGCVYAHSHCGLVAKTGTATIKDITVAGTMNVYSNNIPNIDTNNEPTYGARVGGLVAQHKDGTLTVTNVKALQTVNVWGHEGGRNRVGGLIGDAVGGTVDLGDKDDDTTKCIVGCNINNTQDDAMETTTCSFGGVIGQSNGSTINVNNVQLSGSGTGEKFSLSVKNAAGDAKTSPSVGGFLGYEWLNTNTYINKLVIGTTENQALLKQDNKNAVIGGLLKKATGFVQLNSLTFTNARIEAYNNPTSFGMIVNDGKELYLEVTDQEWYDIDGLSCNIGTPGVYDEFVAYTNKNGIAQNENGVVSIPTSDRGGITTSNIYNNRIDTQKNKIDIQKNNADLKTKKNSNTRYYYNIDIYRQAPSTDGQRLLLWSLSQYSNSCKDLFKEHLGIGLNGSEEDYTISGNCNLTGLSYYPIYFPKNKTVNIADGTSITFDSKDITFNGQSDAVVQTAPGKQNQLYMMHRGLFIDLDSSSKDDIRKLVIEGSLTLSGPITKIGSNTGALFCGVVKGSKATGDLYPNSADIKCGTNSEIILKDLYVRGFPDSDSSTNTTTSLAPLLIGSTGGYININLVGVKTYVGTDNPDNTYALPSGQSYAASSLIGPVGYTGTDSTQLSQSVNISFSKIALDSRKTADNSLDSFYGTQKSIFSRATLLESFRYKTNSGSTGTYDFELKEDWNVNTEPYIGLHKVTYGKELSHSVEFKEKDKEVKICYLKSDIFVSADLSHLTNVEGSAYDFTSATYLPYVYHSPATDNTNYSVAKSYHELKINDAAENFTGGCGTYGDPYRITAKNSQNELVGSDQLSTLANILFSGNFSAGYEIGYNKSSDDCRKSVENGDGFEKHDVYRYQSGSFCKVVGDVVDENDTVDADVIFNHIRDAYYIIEDDITVETNFRGLGVESAPSQIFRGVIVGKKKADNTYPTLTMNGDKPLVKISGGCVVKNLNINYSNNFTITENKGGAFEPTNASVITIGCNYFGGVIGQVLAGDNIIDNVNVTFKRPDNSNTQITLNGTYSYRVPVGAYVGVVRNGGLILRGMSAKDTLSGNNLLIYDNDQLYNTEPFNMSDTNYLYINPYVGRVLDGYVVTDDEGEFGDSAVNNGDKNYSVVKLKKETSEESENNKLSMTFIEGTNKLSDLPKNSTDKTDFTWSNIQVPNAQSLFVLSAMVASGAAAYQATGAGDPQKANTFHYYTDTSYCIGSTHLANYTNVQNLTDLTNADYVIAKTDVRGKNAKSPATEASNAIPYIVKYYTKKQTAINTSNKEILDQYPTRIICSTNTRFSVTLSTANTTYNMPKGFRGINAMYNNTSYSNNPDRQVINMFGFNGNGCTVNMDMNILSYGDNDAYNPFGVGLYTRFQQNTSGEANPDKLQDALINNDFSSITAKNLTTYKETYAVTDLTITGELSYNVPTQNGVKATTEFRNMNNSVIISQTVNVGGFAGRNYDSNSKTLYYWFNNITANANLSGGFGTGALIGAIGDFENGTKGYDGKGATGNNNIGSAAVQTIVANNISSNGLNISAAKYAGGLFGVVTKANSGIWVDCAGNINSTPAKPVIVSSITASMEENRCGGLIGSTSKKLTVKNTKVMGASGALGVIGETAENTYKSTKHAGGIAGYVGGDSDVRDSEVNGLSVNVRSDKENNYAGGMIGYTEGKGTYSDCVVDSCTVYVRNGHSGNVGGLCGRIKGEGNIQHIVVKDNIIKINNNGNDIHTRLGGVVGSINGNELHGFNILLKDNDMQVLYNGSVPTTYKSNTAVGNWVGNSSGQIVKLVAVSKQGDASKYMKDDVGYVGNNLNSKNSIVYSDYNGSALGGTHNTNGKSPYLHINPVAQNLTDLPKMDGTSGSETVLGNGLDLWTDVSDNKKYPLAKHIIDEATDDTVDNTDYSKIVNDEKVLVLSNSFTFSADDGNVITFNTQIRNDNSNGVDLNLPEVPEETDFPVLVIKNNETEAVNSLVKDYISVLTNETKLNINSWEVKTYKRTNTGWTTVNVRNSLNVSASGKELTSVPGQYDNEKGQFTMIKAAIDSPVSDSSDKLELYIPVVVKKVLQFKVDTKVVSDTKYRTGEYNRGRVIENNGVPVTTLITFSYCSRTYQEWLDSINNGEDYFWNYNKCIMFKHDDGQRALPHEDKPAQVTLVDKNNDDKAYYGTLAENGVFNAENGKIDFQHLKEYTGSTNEKSFEPVTLAKLLCEQLELKAVATEDADVCFVEIDEKDIGKNDRSVPTVMAYLNGKPAYFRLYDADDEAAQKPKYAISIGYTYNPSVVKNITEQYYLTLKTDKSIDDLFYMRVMFSPKSLPSENAKMATYNITEQNEYDTLVLANFFTQDNFKIITSGNEEITDSTSFITTDMSVDLTFKKDNYSAFNEYGRNVGLEQGFVMSYVKYSADNSNKEAQQILGDTKLDGTYYVKDNNGDVIAEDGIDETISSSCSEYLLRYKGDDLRSLLVPEENQTLTEDKTITMNAHFKIMFSEFDDSMIELQFPSHQSGSNEDSNTADKSGLVVCGKSNIAYETAKLQNSIVSTGHAVEDGYGYLDDKNNEPKDANRYYCSIAEQASLQYNAVNEDTGDSLGKISQLGINANELSSDVSKVRINALGIYDASVLNEAREADTLVLEFELKRKYMNSNSYDPNGVGDIGDYLKNFDLIVAGTPYKDDLVKDGNVYRVEIDDWKKISGDNATVEIKTTFDVLTNEDFQNKTFMYSNYKLTLTPCLKKGGITVTGSNADSDWIVYTNSRINTDIIDDGSTV